MARGICSLSALPWVHHDFSAAVEALTTTVLGQYTLPAGTWLIQQYMDLSAHVAISDGAYNNVIRLPGVVSQTCRQIGHNGGGCINSITIKITQPQTFNCEGYCPKAVTMRASVNAIRIGE